MSGAHAVLVGVERGALGNGGLHVLIGDLHAALHLELDDLHLRELLLEPLTVLLDREPLARERQLELVGVEVILRGSSITGHKHGSDEPFDADGPGTSDLDVTFVGGNMVMLYNEFHIHSIHSVPLSDEHPYASAALGPLRGKLCEMTGRPVNIQATTSLVQFVRDIVMDQPYLVLLKKPEADEAADI